MKASYRLKQHQREVLEIAGRYEREGLYNLRVFGSVARGDDTEESDIDFMVDVNPNLRPSLYTLIGISDELEDVLGIKVDVISSASVPAQLRERLASEAVAL